MNHKKTNHKTSTFKVLVTCFDVSGDHNAADLIKFAQEQLPQQFQFITIAGEKVAELAGKDVVPLRSHITESSVGVLEGIPYVLPTLKFFSWFKHYLKKTPIDLLLCIDGQGRNLKLGQIAHQLGVKTAYFFPPQVSIYGAWNIKKMKKTFDLVLCPFKPDHELYLAGGVHSIFTGHPFGILSLATKQEQEVYKSTPTTKVISIFPGSRFQEINKLLPVFLKTAIRLKERHPELTFIISCAHQYLRPLIDKKVEQYWQPQKNQSKNTKLQIIYGEWDQILKASYFVLASSGTVTLKASFWGIPHVICYKISTLSYWVARWMIKVNYIGMANILANQEICPEFINRRFTAANLFDYTSNIITHPQQHNAIKEELLRHTQKWKTGNAFEVIFNSIKNILVK